MEVLVAIVNVDEPAGVTEAGLKLPVAPAGNPLTVNPTLLLNPFTLPTLAV